MAIIISAAILAARKLAQAPNTAQPATIGDAVATARKIVRYVVVN